LRFDTVPKSEAVGFPGAIGCTDVVHLWWDKCPMSLTNFYTVKEGYPTIAYEMTCDHSGRILYCTLGFYGSQNDKSIIRFDGDLMLMCVINSSTKMEKKLH
jgi:hypothetical protein